MKTKRQLLAAELFLDTITAGLGRPVITQQPQSQNHVVSTTATFTAPAAGTPPLGHTSRLALLVFQAVLSALLIGTPRTLRAQTNAYFVADTNGSPAYVLVVDERAGNLTVNVNRVGNYDFPSSVHYRAATDDGSAIAGKDFLPTEGTLTFAANETNQTFTVAILDDDTIEGNKVFYITLDQATGGVRIQNPSVGVSILDSEQNPVRLDPDFNPEWPVVESFHLTAVQPADGKILLVTPADRVTGEDGVLVLRLLPDGRPDPAWQTAAVSVVSYALGWLVLQTNGQVLIAPLYYDYPGEDWSPNFSVNGVPRHHLARLNADGSLDTAFVTSLASDVRVAQLAVQRDGQILVVTSSDNLFRLHPSGALDTTFNPPPVDRGSSIMALPDGSIILGRVGLTRLKPDGSRDTTFQPPPEPVSIMAMQPDGCLLVTFWTNDVPYLTRLTLDGRFDATFTFIPVREGIIQVLPATDGKIWVATGNGWSDDSFRLQRKQADGSDDPTWPVAILGTLRVAGSTTAVVLQELPDGNLLFAGIPSSDRVNGQLRTGLARLLVNAPLPRFEVHFTSALVPENGGKVAIKLVRCGTNTEPITVTWRTEGGTAKAGVDYVSASGTLTFPAHESVATIELEVLDNAVLDADRTVRLRLQGPPPLSQEYPAVELTIANDDLGFAPEGIKRLPNSLVLLRYTGLPIPAWGDVGGWRAAPMGPGPGRSHIIGTSENLRDWQEHDAYLEFVRREWIDAATNAARFYRLRRSSQ